MMGDRKLCLIAWTIAVGVLTGTLSGSHGQCGGSTRPAQLVANQNKANIDFQYLSSNTSDTTCEWIISSKTIARLQLTVGTFKLRSDNGSCVDIFTVYDGNSSNSPILLSTCSRPSFPINSSGSDVLVSFTAGNNESSDIGFLIEYESFWSTEHCSSVLLVSVGPDRKYLEYPTNANSTSPRNFNCGWLFQSSSADNIVIIDILADFFDSSNFYIKVFDGPGEVNLLDRLWEYPTQKQFYSSGQYLYIYLVRSSTLDGESLNVTYHEVPRPTLVNTSACSCNCSVRVSHINKYYLKYPADQERYPNNANCFWQLTSAPDYVIHLTFLYVNTEPDDDCYSDYVQVLDGLPLLSNKLDAFCEGQHEFYSSGHSLFIKFHSNSMDTGQGFLTSFEAVRPSDVPQDIGGKCLRKTVIKTVTHTPQSLVYPSNSSTYADNTDCEWILHATGSDDVVHVTFTFVDIEGSGSYCSSDYVQVFDGALSSSESFGKFCGSTSRDFYSSGQFMMIKFHSDYRKEGGGFRLNYRAIYRWNAPTRTDEVCLDGVTKTATYTPQSLVYPSSSYYYDNNTDCEWILHATGSDDVVHVTFTFVDIEGSGSYCSSDYVQINDGSGSPASYLGKVCGSTSRDFYSSGRYMVIRFHSDSSVTRRGFRLNYQAVYRWNTLTTAASVCSRTTQTKTAWLSSEETLQFPANNLNYPNNADCGWLLQTNSYDFVVHVTFTFVSTESSYSCSYDYIEVFDGSSASANSLGRLCGTTSRDFYSSGQSVFIKFHSDGSGTGSGFRLTYQALGSWEVPKADSVSPAVISGAVVGGVVFLIAVVVVIVSCKRRRLQQPQRNRPSNTTNNQYIAYFYPGNGSAPNVGSGPPHVPPSVITGPRYFSAGPPPYHLVIGSAPNVGQPSVGSGSPHVTSDTPPFPPSVIVGPPSVSLDPPPYHLVSQSTGGSYPGTNVNLNSPLQQNSQQPMTRGPSSGEPLANEDKNNEENLSIRL